MYEVAIVAKSIILIILLLIVPLAIGDVICGVVNSKRDVTKSFIIGIICNLTVFELLALPVMIFQIRFSILYRTYIVVVIVEILISMIWTFRNKEQYRFEYPIKANKYLIIIALSLIFFQMVFSNFGYHEDDDDGYYITISNYAVFEDKIEKDVGILYEGIYSNEKSFQPPVVSWELLIAFFSKALKIKPVIVAHSVLPLYLIFICYIAIYRLAKQLVNKENSVWIFMICYSIINMWGGYAVRTPSSFMLLRIWQGKAILVNFIFPVLIENIISMVKDNDIGYKKWMYNMAILVSGIGLSLIAIQILPIYYVLMGIPFLIYTIFNQREKVVLLFAGAFISLIPSILIGIASIITVFSTESGISYSKKAVESWTNALYTTIGESNNGYLMALCISMIIVFILGEKHQKDVIVYPSLILVLTFLNPYFKDIVGGMITGAGVYWRLWWCVPVITVISLAIVIICDRMERYKEIILLFALTIIILFGTFMYKPGLYFKKYINSYKLPNEMNALIDCVTNNLEENEKVTIMAPYYLSCKFRQIDLRIIVPAAKFMNYNNAIIEDTSYTYSEFYESVYDGRIDDEEILEILDMLNIEFIISDCELKSRNIVCQELIKGYYVYKL